VFTDVLPAMASVPTITTVELFSFSAVCSLPLT